MKRDSCTLIILILTIFLHYFHYSTFIVSYPNYLFSDTCVLVNIPSSILNFHDSMRIFDCSHITLILSSPNTFHSTAVDCIQHQSNTMGTVRAIHKRIISRSHWYLQGNTLRGFYLFSTLLFCSVLSCPVLSCPVLSCPVLS